MSVDTVTRPDQETQTGSKGPKYAHIVYPKQMLTDAIIYGSPVAALCGHVFVPGRDPKQYALCQRCKEIMESTHGQGSSPVE